MPTCLLRQDTGITAGEMVVNAKTKAREGYAAFPFAVSGPAMDPCES